MALKEQKIEPTAVVVPDGEELRELEQNVQSLQAQDALRQRELAQIDADCLLEGEVYNRERIEAEIDWHGQAIGEHLFHIGRKLILLKEHEGHGYFGKALERFGIAPRTATEWMAATIAHLQSKSALGADLGVKKLAVLKQLGREGLEALGEGQTVAGLVLDELDKMSYSELKTQVRGHKAELKALQEAQDKVFAQKDKALTEKDKEILRLEKELARPSADGMEKRRQLAIDMAMHELRLESDKFRAAAEGYLLKLDALCAVEGISQEELSGLQEELLAWLGPVGELWDDIDGRIPTLTPLAESAGQGEV